MDAFERKYGVTKPIFFIDAQIGIAHSSTCNNNVSCLSGSCPRLKRLLEHEHVCELKEVGGCNQCSYYWLVLREHASQCEVYDCAVERCKMLKPKRFSPMRMLIGSIRPRRREIAKSNVSSIDLYDDDPRDTRGESDDQFREESLDVDEFVKQTQL